ncbi:V-type ATP synthase subunit A [Candidatus Woesearchaeota archaeon]|nr:V-type ATP synthase subunit A [Candidatus Woesearchaeota archaeon]
MSKATIIKGEVNKGTASDGTSSDGNPGNREDSKGTISKRTIGKGTIFRVAGPVIEAKNIDAKMYDVVIVGKERLMGEVIRIQEELTTIQVYEDTSNIKPGEDVEVTGMPLSVELGPGLLSSIYDGIQRPLPVLRDQMGDFIKRGVQAPGLDHKKKWEFKAAAKKGDEVKGGAVIGTVEEMPGIVHKIMVKPDVHGKIESIKSGSFTVDEAVGELEDGTELKLFHQWPVRIPRPVAKKLMPETPLVTGQRVIDGLFPVAKGGVAAIPGPFGAGKTVSQQQLAKWSDADIIVYIGCGERGNEMTEVLTEFPHLTDPKSGKPLMNRTVLIANTSNMPVAAREASVYTGITIAEYFRDMGYDVALMADSTSRWAEAMREISSRLEEMPGEEGYPAYLSTRLAEFYERAGRVIPLGTDKAGSVTVIGAVSPPGGDFSEPVTQGTLRVIKTFWALDAKLAQRRHFPSINWLTSYSLYQDTLSGWFNKEIAPDWSDRVRQMKTLLQEEEKLLEIVQLVGSDALPEKQQITLETARLIREFFLQQNAYHEVDTYCDLKKAYRTMGLILQFGQKAQEALGKGADIQRILGIKTKDRIGEVKFDKNHDALLNLLEAEMRKEFDAVGAE